MRRILSKELNEENGLRKGQLFCSTIHSTATMANRYELPKHVNIIINVEHK